MPHKPPTPTPPHCLYQNTKQTEQVCNYRRLKPNQKTVIKAGISSVYPILKVAILFIAIWYKK